MVDTFNTAKVHEALSLLYTDTAKVTGSVSEKDPATKETHESLVVLHEALACRVSFKRTDAASEASPAAVVSQSVTLFFAPDVVIPSGCLIEVTRGGRTLTYGRAGLSAVYASHIEVALETDEVRT